MQEKRITVEALRRIPWEMPSDVLLQFLVSGVGAAVPSGRKFRATLGCCDIDSVEVVLIWRVIFALTQFCAWRAK